MAIDFAFTTVIERPPADVFAVVTDVERLPQWQPRVVEAKVLDGGAPRVGARIREVRRVGGRRLEQLVRVSAHEPPRRFALEIVEVPLAVDGDLTFTEAGDGSTELRFRAHGRARGPLRLLEPLLARVLERDSRRQYAALKAVVERGPAA